MIHSVIVPNYLCDFYLSHVFFPVQYSIILNKYYVKMQFYLEVSTKSLVMCLISSPPPPVISCIPGFEMQERYFIHYMAVSCKCELFSSCYCTVVFLIS